MVTASKLRKKESELLYPINEDDETDYYNSGSDLTPLSNNSSRKYRRPLITSSHARLHEEDDDEGHGTDDSDCDSEEENEAMDKLNHAVGVGGTTTNENGVEEEDSDEEDNIPDW